MTNTQFENMMAELRAMRAVLERTGVEARDEVPAASTFAEAKIAPDLKGIGPVVGIPKKARGRR